MAVGKTHSYEFIFICFMRQSSTLVFAFLFSGTNTKADSIFGSWLMRIKHGIHQWHNFPASHHFAGPHDNAGKVPRIKMKSEEAADRHRIYNYHLCYEFCKKHMAEPCDDKEHIGTWGCNGTCNTRSNLCSVCLFCVFSQVSMFGWRFRMEKILTNINTRR